MTNSFIESLKKNASRTTTENCDITYSTTLNANLDFFGAAGALRRRLDEVAGLFEEALDEDKETAILNMFYLRDIRGGVGERDAFRKAYQAFAKKYPKDAVKLIPAVVDYGRWDDIFCLMDLGNDKITSAIAEAVKQQLVKDIADASAGKSISLCAKWMPSINTSSEKACANARVLARKMGLSEKEYRKMLASLRKYIDILERHMSARDYTFDYSKLPSKALMKHVKAFTRNDKERYEAYKEALSEGKIKAKTKAVYPYEITTMEDRELREAMWRDIERYPGETKTIVVRDGSGSMGWMGFYNNKVQPIDVATSLAILFSEQLTGEFKDKFITFSSYPQFVDLSHKTTLEAKLNKCRKFNECSNTDIMKVYKLILEAEKQCDPKDWIERIVIISDMQFDQGTCGVPTYDEAKAMYKEAGIPLPKIVYWNVASRVDFPSSDLKNVRFVSGLSQYTIEAILNDTAMDAVGFMCTTLAKYEPVLKLLGKAPEVSTPDSETEIRESHRRGRRIRPLL